MNGACRPEGGTVRRRPSVDQLWSRSQPRRLLWRQHASFWRRGRSSARTQKTR